MVAPAGVARGAHLVVGVGGHEELSALVGEVVGGLAERAVIDPPGLLRSDELAVLVRADADVHEERRAFRRADVVLLHVYAHVDGASAGDERYREVGLVGRRDFVAERSAEVVLDDADSRRRDADAARYHHLVAVDAYRLRGYREKAVLVVVGVSAVRFKDHVRLARAEEFVVDYVLGVVERFLRVFALHVDALVPRVRHSVVAVDVLVDLYRIGSLGLVDVDELGQRLVVDLDFLRRGARVGLGVGADDGDDVAPLAYLVALFDHYAALPAVGERGVAADLSADAVRSLDVLIGDYLEYAGHLLRFADVDFVDLRVADALKRVGICEEEFLGQLQPVVVAEVPEPRRLVYSGGTRIAAVPDGVAGLVHLSEVFNFLLAAQDGGGLHNRVDYLLVAGAAAGHPVLAEPLADLFARRVRVLVEERLAARDEAGRAEAALNRSADYHGPLERVEVVRRAYSFDCGDLRELGHVLPARDAGADDLAVEYYVADAALAAVAAALRPRHFELVAEHRQKRYVGLADYAFRHSVDDQVLDMIAGLGRNCDFLRHICSPLS